MGRRRRRLDPSDPLQGFALELRALRDSAGEAGGCAETCKAAKIQRTTYYAWLAGTQLPRQDALDLVVQAWGAKDVGYWMTRRREVEDAMAQPALRQPQQAQLSPVQYVSTAERLGLARFYRLRSAKIADARQVLLMMGFDRERTNERSALMLLALLGLGPETDWREAQQPALRLREIMDWLRDHYGKDYSPNSREVLRRFTLHQFVESGLVVQNPDDPGRSPKSPKWCYQVDSKVYEILLLHGSGKFEQRLKEGWNSDKAIG